MSYDLASEGLFFKMGVLDFAGGTVVHECWLAALAGAMFLGKKAQKSTCTYYAYVLGTGLLFGWFDSMQFCLVQMD
jgi:Amt family ammonium transporter